MHDSRGSRVDVRKYTRARVWSHTNVPRNNKSCHAADRVPRRETFPFVAGGRQIQADSETRRVGLQPLLVLLREYTDNATEKLANGDGGT